MYVVQVRLNDAKLWTVHEFHPSREDAQEQVKWMRRMSGAGRKWRFREIVKNKFPVR